jgi:hypothetical protein
MRYKLKIRTWLKPSCAINDQMAFTPEFCCNYSKKCDFFNKLKKPRKAELKDVIVPRDGVKIGVSSQDE